MPGRTCTSFVAGCRHRGWWLAGWCPRCSRHFQSSRLQQVEQGSRIPHIIVLSSRFCKPPSIAGKLKWAHCIKITSTSRVLFLHNVTSPVLPTGPLLAAAKLCHCPGQCPGTFPRLLPAFAGLSSTSVDCKQYSLIHSHKNIEAHLWCLFLYRLIRYGFEIVNHVFSATPNGAGRHRLRAGIR